MKKGFSLIELLVVIAIVSILSSVIFVGFDIARARSRDAARKSGLGEIHTALNFYYNDHGSFPPDSDSGKICSGCTAGINSVLSERMGGIPTDPLNDATHYYYYDGSQACTGRGYQGDTAAMIFTFLENEASPTAEGKSNSPCASYGGEGGSKASNAYHIIVGSSSL